MLFRKKMERACAYCTRAVKIDEDTVACVKKGVVSADGACRRFRYDPLKRTPPRPIKLNTARLSEEDFSI